MTFIEKLKRFNPISVYRLFKHIHTFADYDKEIAGYKYAIFYGRLYFERSRYKQNGDLDLSERSRRIDTILNEYKCPNSYIDYVRSLRGLRDGLEQAAAEGYIYTGSGKDITTNKYIQNEETAHYQLAIDSLDTLIPAVTFYPYLWWIVFRQRS